MQSFLEDGYITDSMNRRFIRLNSSYFNHSIYRFYTTANDVVTIIMPFFINWTAPGISMTITPVVLFLFFSNANAMYDYFHDATVDTQISNHGHTSKLSLSHCVGLLDIYFYYIMIYAYVN